MEGSSAEGSCADIEIRFRKVPGQKVLAQKVPLQILRSGSGAEKMKRRRRTVKLLGIALEFI